MNPMKRTGLKLLGLCVLALGLMAFSATAAQAEGQWMIKGAGLESGAKELKGKLVSPGGKLVATLGLNKTKFVCKLGSLVNANLEEMGGISVASKNAKVKFAECTTEINGAVAPKCEPITGAEKGVIVSKEGSALLVSHSPTGENNEGVTIISPKEGNVFAILSLGASCAIGEEVKVFGKLAVKDSAGTKEGLEKETQIHTIEEFAALTELKVASETSESKAILEGKAEVELTNGEIWSGLPLRLVTTVGGNNQNPFMLNGEVVRVVKFPGTGNITGGTCVAGAIVASLTTCTVTQAAPTGSAVWWRAL